MTDLKHHYGPAEGPLGFPLTDKQAFALEAVLKALPRDSAFNYRKKTCGTALENRPTEVLGSERSDISWISTEDPDRMGEVVSAKGMSDSQFRLNPIVTLNHCYDMPPVGKSLWRKVGQTFLSAQKEEPNSKNQDWNLELGSSSRVKGIKAKTQYPARPADWTENKDWPADVAFSLVQADLLRGKSIGFLPVKVHTPTSREIEQWATRAGTGVSPVGDRRDAGPTVNLVIDEWILLEYACVFLPAQQNAVVESVSKGFVIPQEFQKALGMGEDRFVVPPSGGGGQPPKGGTTSRVTGAPLMAQKSFDPRSSILDLRSFTRLSEIEKAIQRQIEAIDLAAACRSRLDERLDLLRGRI
jgi:hypothetical protein